MSSYASSPLRKLAPCCAVLLAAGLGCRAHAAEYTKSYAVTGTADVVVNSDNGSVRVNPSDGAKVEFDVKYDKSEWGTDANAGPYIDSHQAGNEVQLTAFVSEPGSGWWDWMSFNPNGFDRHLGIAVHMPKNANLQLQTRNGSIDVSSLNGKIVVTTRNGTVTGAQLSGTIDVDSRNGGITLDGVKGAIKVDTRNGSIAATGIDGRCELVTRNGSVRAAGRFDALDIDTRNGRVVARAEAGSRMSSGWSIRSSNAAVDVALPADLKATVDAGTNRGWISMDLPAQQSNQSGTQIRRDLNGGGPDLLIRTTNGGIHVSGV